MAYTVYVSVIQPKSKKLPDELLFLKDQDIQGAYSHSQRVDEPFVAALAALIEHLASSDKARWALVRVQESQELTDQLNEHFGLPRLPQDLEDKADDGSLLPDD